MPCFFSHWSRFWALAALISSLSLQASAQLSALEGLGLSAPADDHPVKPRLLAEPQGITPGQTFTVALELTLEPTWHVYWTNPGGPGFPPSIQWVLPEGFVADNIQWPAPHHFEAAGITQYGYENKAMLLIDITAPENIQAGSQVTLTAKTKWLMCQEICIPGNETLSINLPVVSKPADANPEHTSAFAQARQQIPTAADADASIQISTNEMIATFPGVSLPQGVTAHLYPSSAGIFASESKQMVTQSEGDLIIRVPLLDGFNLEDTPRFKGVIGFESENGEYLQPLKIDTLITAYKSQEVSVPISPSKLLSTLGFAFLGGIVLNLMPCVFPVLSLKIMGFVQQAGENTRIIKLHGLVFGAGVLISFWALAGALLALRAGGDSLGWGYQLSSPNFVLGMLFLIFGLGLSLAGVFEIGTGMTRLAGNIDGKPDGYGKSFFSGVLATVIATPCTGPFMGAALGVALAAPSYQAMLIFTSLAMGMAAPYMLLSFFPKALNYLPRPGAWMETFKQLMAFPMFATAAWLMGVYIALKGEDIIIPLGLGLTLLAMGAWAYGRYTRPHLSNRLQWFGRVAGVACLIASVLIVANRREGMVTWEPFEETALTERRQEERPVFVDFTATWCLSCIANKKSSLRTPAADKLFLANNVAVMEADWTDQNERILKVLEKHGRSGVPLYLVFPKDPNAEPKILPNILTPGIVREAIEWAAGEG